jgi:hypothetical protein
MGQRMRAKLLVAVATVAVAVEIVTRDCMIGTGLPQATA